jgi:hypothetical protein
MTASDGMHYVEQQIEKSLTDFSATKGFFRRGSLYQTVLSASLTALTTFLIALNQIYKEPWLTALSLASAGLATIATAWTGWFGFRQAWINYQGAQNSLEALRSKIEYDKALYGADPNREKVEGYFEQYQKILLETNHSWEQIRAERQ